MWKIYDYLFEHFDGFFVGRGIHYEHWKLFENCASKQITEEQSDSVCSLINLDHVETFLEKHVPITTTLELLHLIMVVKKTRDFSIFNQRSRQNIKAHNQFFHNIESFGSLIDSIGATMNFWRFKIYYFLKYKDLSLFLKMQNKDLEKFLFLLFDIMKKTGQNYRYPRVFIKLWSNKGEAVANKQEFYNEFKSFPNEAYDDARTLVFHGQTFTECHNEIISTLKLLENLKITVLNIEITNTDVFGAFFRGKNMQKKYHIFMKWIYSDLKDAEIYKNWLMEGVAIDHFYKLYNDGLFCEEIQFEEESFEYTLFEGACSGIYALDEKEQDFFKKSLRNVWWVVDFSNILTKYIERRKMHMDIAIGWRKILQEKKNNDLIN